MVMTTDARTPADIASVARCIGFFVTGSLGVTGEEKANAGRVGTSRGVAVVPDFAQASYGFCPFRCTSGGLGQHSFPLRPSPLVGGEGEKNASHHYLALIHTSRFVQRYLLGDSR